MSAEVSLVIFSEKFQLDVQILLVVFLDLAPSNSPKSVCIFVKIDIFRTRRFVKCRINFENHLFCKLFLLESELDRVYFKQNWVEMIIGFHTQFKLRFDGNVLEKIGEMFDSVESAVSFNKLNKGVDKMPSNAKRRILRKKFIKNMLTSVQSSI